MSWVRDWSSFNHNKITRNSKVLTWRRSLLLVCEVFVFLAWDETWQLRSVLRCQCTGGSETEGFADVTFDGPEPSYSTACLLISANIYIFFIQMNPKLSENLKGSKKLVGRLFYLLALQVLTQPLITPSMASMIVAFIQWYNLFHKVEGPLYNVSLTVLSYSCW